MNSFEQGRHAAFEKLAISPERAAEVLQGPAMMARLEGELKDMPPMDVTRYFHDKLWRTTQRSQGIPREEMVAQHEKMTELFKSLGMLERGPNETAMNEDITRMLKDMPKE